MILIFVMTLIQDAAFKTINEKGIPIIFVNNDKDSLGILIEQGLRNNDLCSFHDSIDGKPATAESAHKAVSEGKFLVGIVIPKGATNAIRKNVTELVDETMNTDSIAENSNPAIDSVEITLMIDPVAKKSFLISVTSNLYEFISEVKTKIMFQTFPTRLQVIPENLQLKKCIPETQIIKYKKFMHPARKIVPMLFSTMFRHGLFLLCFSLLYRYQAAS
jgi:ABC-2 type transport system permease protein